MSLSLTSRPFGGLVSRCSQNLFLFKEPVGAVAPKINTGENIQVIRGFIGDGLNILCPAQAFPTPIFRYLRTGIFGT